MADTCDNCAANEKELQDAEAEARQAKEDLEAAQETIEELERKIARLEGHAQEAIDLLTDNLNYEKRRV